MKQALRKWSLRLSVTSLLLLGTLTLAILNPSLAYSHRTIYKNYTIHHQEPLNALLFAQLDQVTNDLRTSELYHSSVRFDICLKDGSCYPAFVETVLGRAFAHSFYNKVVMLGKANYEANYLDRYGHHWNLTQLLAHEMTHCLQFGKYGLWRSNPVGNIPNWKWEGYPEYVARQAGNQHNLKQNIARYMQSDPTEWGVKLADNTLVSRPYYQYWLLVQYCLDIQKISYPQLLANRATEQDIEKQMMRWYAQPQTQ